MKPAQRQTPTVGANDRYARFHAEARCLIQQATALKEEAAAMRLRLWLEWLPRLRRHADRDTALERALDAAISVGSADGANIQLVHPSRCGLVLKAQRGFRRPFLDFFAFVSDRHSACGVALEERRPVVVEDVLRSPIFAQTTGLDVMLEAGVRAVKSLPLVGPAGRILGMLSVHYRRPRAHIDSDLTRLQTLAAAVSDLIGG
jgi:GAF domain-containing protein